MSEILKAAIMGAVQGLTEFLPISSSAHLLALHEVLDFELRGVAFDVSVHLATALAVLVYFRGDLIRIVRGDRLWPVVLRIGVATVPAVILGFILKSFREGVSPWFAVGGWAFSGTYLLLTRGRGGDIEYSRMPLAKAFVIGCAQSLAIFPGVSRSGATISAALWLGLAREESARFSFLLAIPAILGAGVLEGLDLLRSPEPAGEFLSLCAIGMPVAFLVGLVAIHLLLRVVRGRIFHRFGWYNLAASIAFGAYLLFR